MNTCTPGVCHTFRWSPLELFYPRRARPGPGPQKCRKRRGSRRLSAPEGYRGTSLKPPPRRTLRWDHAWAPMAVLGGGAVSNERGNPAHSPQPEAPHQQQIRIHLDFKRAFTRQDRRDAHTLVAGEGGACSLAEDPKRRTSNQQQIRIHPGDRLRALERVTCWMHPDVKSSLSAWSH